MQFKMKFSYINFITELTHNVYKNYNAKDQLKLFYYYVFWLESINVRN
jgi:hypothetical protein